MKIARNPYFLITFLFALATVAALPVAAQAPAQVSTVVTAIHDGPGPMPVISREDVVVRQDRQVRPVTGWEPLSGSKAGLDVAVLIDDSLTAGVALRWKEVRRFLLDLPPDARVAVAYGQYGGATIAQPFTTNHKVAADALRLPLAQVNMAASIYLCVRDLINKWPADHNRRVILLISDGIDIFYGYRESQPGLNINLRRAIDAAQKDGVMVYTIFATGAAAYSRNGYLLLNGQSCLGRLGLESGGASYQLGWQTPLDFTPYLKEIAEFLSHQYLLTFTPKLGPKADYSQLQLAVEKNGVELRGPARIYLPAAH